MTAAVKPLIPHAADERRTQARKDVAIAAKIGFRDQPPVPCMVRNITAMGAMLEFAQPIELPANLRIIIESEMFAADCEVRHQTGLRAGVLFTSSRLEAMARFG